MNLSLNESYELTHCTEETDSDFGDLLNYLLHINYADNLKEAKSFVGCMSEALFYELLSEARALGKAGGKGADDNVKGGAARVSSGSGITLTPAAGLGKEKPKGSDKKRADRYKAQLRKDKMAERGISPEQRRKRAQDNIAKKIDAALKD